MQQIKGNAKQNEVGSSLLTKRKKTTTVKAHTPPRRI